MEREAGSGRNRIGMWYVLNCGVRMMVYGMVLWYYGTVCTARGYLQYQPTNFRTKLDKKDYRNPTGRFSEFGGFRPAIYENSCRTAGHLHVTVTHARRYDNILLKTMFYIHTTYIHTYIHTTYIHTYIQQTSARGMVLYHTIR